MPPNRIPTVLALLTVTAPGAAVAEGAVADGLNLVPMGELVVPIVEGARANGRLRLRLVLRAGTAADAARLQATLPALREASVAAAAEFARLYASPLTPVDARQLARDIGAALRARDHGVAMVLVIEVAAFRA